MAASMAEALRPSWCLVLSRISVSIILIWQAISFLCCRSESAAGPSTTPALETMAA